MQEQRPETKLLYSAPFMRVVESAPAVAAAGPAAGYTLWYDFSDISTLWQDTGATSAVTTDGQSIARIDDKSISGNNATQSNASLRPVYKTGIKNGLSSGLFTSDYLIFTNLGALTQYSLFVVSNANGSANMTPFMNQNVGNHFIRVTYTSTNVAVVSGGLAITVNTPGGSWSYSSGWTILTSKAQSGVSSYLKINSSTYTGTTGSFASVTGTPYNYVGFYRPNELFWSDYISEILFYPTVLSTEDETTTVNYLNAKWSVY